MSLCLFIFTGVYFTFFTFAWSALIDFQYYSDVCFSPSPIYTLNYIIFDHPSTHLSFSIFAIWKSENITPSSSFQSVTWFLNKSEHPETFSPLRRSIPSYLTDFQWGGHRCKARPYLQTHSPQFQNKRFPWMENGGLHTI